MADYHDVYLTDDEIKVISFLVKTDLEYYRGILDIEDEQKSDIIMVLENILRKLRYFDYQGR